MKKRLLSMLLVLVMLLGVLPVTALADSEAPIPVERVSTGEEDPVQITKSLESNGDGTYRITMESYVTGTVVQGKPEPLDIVLVLDQSGSMAFNFNGDETNNNATRRQYAMKNAVNSFIGKVADHSSENYISVVTFASNASILADWTKVTTEGEAALIDSINGLRDSPRGATNVADGMTKAKNLLNSADRGHKKVLIVFTDGVPTTSTDFDTSVATEAIQVSKNMKDAGVTVYTIGIFNGADPSQLYGDKWSYTLANSIPCDGEVGSYWGGSWLSEFVGGNDFAGIDIPAGNRFLNYLSSNFTTADEIGLERGSFNPGNVFFGDGNGYKITKNFEPTASGHYLIASDENSLYSIFGQIAESIVPAVAAGSNAVLSDTLTDHFEFAIGEDGKVRGLSAKVYSASGSGETPNWAEVPAEIEPVISGKTITAAGFDYSGNPVVKGNDGWTGRKLVISFDIQPDVNADWMRGTNLYDTNNTTGSKAGLSVDGSALSELSDSPNVEVTAYGVTYSWTGLPEGTSVTIPVDNHVYLEGAAVTLDTTYTSTTTTKVGHDTYTFSGWTSVDPALVDGKMPGSNVVVSGTWTKTATDPTYTVTYSWTGLPEGAAVTVPVDSAKYYEGDAVALDTTYTSTSTTTIDGTIYTFSGWTSVVPALVDGKMPGSNVAVSGTWIKTFVPAPGLSVTKDACAINGKPVEADKAYTVKTGDTVTWKITVSNEGNVTLRNVSVTDVLSIGKVGAELELYNADGNKVTAVDLMPKGTDGDVVVLYADYRVTMKDQGEKLVNTVVADAGDNGPRDSDTDDSFQVQVIHVPVLNKKDHVAYIIGYEDDTVRPENNITRAEVATIFFRLLTDDSRVRYWSQTNDFSDVSSSDWFNNAVSTMANAGILTGYPDGTFKPNAPITRAEFAAIAARFSDVAYNGACSFTDVAKTHWAFDEISLAEHLGWITGYPDDTFRPSRNITRGEAMTLINRVLERAVEEDHMHKNMVKWIDNSPSAWYYEAVQEATNSHTYTRLSKKVPGQSFCYEDWTGILKAPDWAALEKSWSDANNR